ncbi:MAG: SurA N-terminal domain-containing protein [Bacteroidales bacterium]|jgi:peptidyl-prolyl cis-trans isomerase D|nr:SurA N-terminal domain-containing protein [Bacteroidales bacterium]
MAVLEKIRSKGGVIIFFIGLGLLLFILPLDDLFNRSRNTDIGKVNEKTFSYQDYDRYVSELTQYEQQNTQSSSLDEYTTDMIYEQAWQTMVARELVEQEYRKTGLTVSAGEVFDMVQGSNPVADIRQNFTNPETGQFDRSLLINFLKNKNMSGNELAAQQWNTLEGNIIQRRYAEKYYNLIAKGLHMPAFVVNNENVELNKKVDFDYVMKTYASIPDSAINLTNADLKRYYTEHRQEWRQEVSRDIEYVVFNIVPSDEDRAAASQWVENIKEDFEKAEDIRQFVTANSVVPFDTKFYKADELPVQAAELFDAQIGDMAGPYQEGEALKLVRLASIENRPDSVKVRQIIIVPRQQTQAAAQQAVALADSVKTLIEKGADFTTLALQYSADPAVQTNNGDIGWIYESTLQAGSIGAQCFEVKKGEVFNRESQQGIFIIQVTDRGREVKKVQLGILQRNINASQRTEQLIYSQASKFAMENRTEAKFNEAVGAQNLIKRVATYIGENDRQIPGLSSARPVVRWAYEADKGAVSEVFALRDAYVVAILKEVREEGAAPLEQVVAEVNIAVKRQKKAAQISTVLLEAAKNATAFGDMALGLGLPVESASGISFSSFSVSGAGIEPELIAAVVSTSEGSISEPIEGANGVFLFTVRQVTEAPSDSIAMESAKIRLSTTFTNRAMTEVDQALRKAAKIKDMRSKFY